MRQEALGTRNKQMEVGIVLTNQEEGMVNRIYQKM